MLKLQKLIIYGEIMSKKEVVKIIEEKIGNERNKLLKLMNKLDNLGLKEELAKEPEIDKINAEIEEKENIKNKYDKKRKIAKGISIFGVIATFPVGILGAIFGFINIVANFPSFLLFATLVGFPIISGLFTDVYSMKAQRIDCEKVDLKFERDRILERRSEKYINLQEKIDNKWNLINQLEKELENYKNINKNKRNLEKFEKETEKKYLKQSEEVLTK